MSQESFRFRLVRAVDQVNTSNALVVQPTGESKPDLTHRVDMAWLTRLSDALAARRDYVAPEDVVALMPGDWREQTKSTNWTAINTYLSNALATATNAAKNAGSGQITTVVPTSQVMAVEAAVRALLVYDLVNTLASDVGQARENRKLQTADDVRAALNFRHVSLPGEYFVRRTKPITMRQPGCTDFYVVKTEWNRYEAAELAAVVNVLPGETLEHRVTHSEETITAQSTTSTQSTTTQDEHSQTTTTSLSQSATQDASMTIGVQGQVDTSGQYGPTEVKTHVGAQLQSSQSTSTSMAHTTATEIVARAVKTVTQTITEVKSRRTTVRDTSADKHALQNQGDKPVVGLYRWLKEIHRVQLMKYPNRFVLEFEVPEPAAWLKWALTHQPDQPWDNPDPGPFEVDGQTGVPLGPEHITETTWTKYVKKWQVQGISPPPAPSATLALALKATSDKVDDSQLMTDNSLMVPDGYKASSWRAHVYAQRNVGDDKSAAVHGTSVTVSVGGGGSQTIGGAAGGQAMWVIDQDLSGNFGSSTVTGTIAISIYAAYTSGFTAAISIECDQVKEPGSGNGQAFERWRETTYDQIVQAYTDLLNAHTQERDARRQQATPDSVLIGPPEANQAHAVAELKRLVIQDLIGVTFDGYDLVHEDTAQPNQPPPAPYVVPGETLSAAPVVQFFEQAFEWENLVYICYPYFWGAKSRWAEKATWASADPVFDQFLNAGSARVVVPARPGFERLVNYYLYTGHVWGGRNPPAPNDPDYLSVADEIETIEKGAQDGTPIDPWWEIELPTTLLWAGTVESTLPQNLHPTIGPAPATP